MLHRRRVRLEALAAREAAGESFWTPGFVDEVRNKIRYAFADAVGSSDVSEVTTIARALILRDEGWQYLASEEFESHYDFLVYFGSCDDTDFPTVVESIVEAIKKTPRSQASLARRRYVTFANPGAEFVATANVIFQEHRVSWELSAQGQMVQFESKELHQEVVVPVLRLLSSATGFESAEAAYLDALGELSAGKPGDAITDAGTALQEVLTALGCDGNALGPLIRSARSKGLLAAHDSSLTDGIQKMFDWVSADRSTLGDAHTASDALTEDAWLAVHVVGALILRLSKATGRSG